MNVLDLFRSRRTPCRHPSDCPTAAGPNELMCPTHAADEAFTVNPDNRLAPWDLNRRAVWPTYRGKRNG